MVLKSKITDKIRKSLEFKKNFDHNRNLSRRIHDLEKILKQGGGEKAIERQHRKKRLTARERIEGVCDPGSRFEELGLFCGVTIPEEQGGFDFPLTAFFGFGEIFSMADSSLGLTPMLNEGCAQVISEFANEKIIKEYLPTLISGERVCAMGLTEPGAGSSPLSTASRTAHVCSSMGGQPGT